MELFNARNLKQEIREDPDQLAINLEVITRRCAEGLQHMHEHNWIICVVKPDNFLVDEEATVKLIDFSIARRPKKGIGSMLRTAKLQGTRSYMAPEQIRRQQISPATDVYGLGCVLFEMLAGRPPFTGNNPDELLTRHLKSSPPSVQASNNRVNDNFASLLNRMLSKKPEDRPRSMADFLTEYEKTRLYKAGRRPTLPAND
jgi:serine/threonine protein kinase